MCRARSLGEHASIEVSSTTARSFVETVDEYRGVDDLLWARRTVFVNMLETCPKGFLGVESAVETLADAGHDPVPHLPASLFESRSHATHVCERLARRGASSALIVGGNRPRSQDGLDATGLAEIAAHRFKSLVFAAFPDGHPRSPDGNASLSDKLERFPDSSVVTQWSSSPAATSRWLAEFRKSSSSNNVVHVGVCGPASHARKATFATFCGVPFHPDDYHQHDAFQSPRDAVLTLAADLDFYDIPTSAVRLHLFTLSLGRTLDFLHKLTAHDITSKSNLLAA